MITGSFYGLSVDTRIDIDECAAISPGTDSTAALVLSLGKDVFQTLGLEGKVSDFTRKSRDRYSEFVFNYLFLIYFFFVFGLCFVVQNVRY